MNKNQILIGVAGLSVLIVTIQWMRFKKVLNDAYTNGASATTPNWISESGSEVVMNQGNSGLKVSKFPFSATVAIGGITNKI